MWEWGGGGYPAWYLCVSFLALPIGQVEAQQKSVNILERWIGVMGKGVRDVTKQAARETTEVAQ